MYRNGKEIEKSVDTIHSNTTKNDKNDDNVRLIRPDAVAVHGERKLQSRHYSRARQEKSRR